MTMKPTFAFVHLDNNTVNTVQYHNTTLLIYPVEIYE